MGVWSQRSCPLNSALLPVEECFTFYGPFPVLSRKASPETRSFTSMVEDDIKVGMKLKLVWKQTLCLCTLLLEYLVHSAK